MITVHHIRIQMACVRRLSSSTNAASPLNLVPRERARNPAGKI